MSCGGGGSAMFVSSGGRRESERAARWLSGSGGRSEALPGQSSSSSRSSAAASPGRSASQSRRGSLRAAAAQPSTAHAPQLSGTATHNNHNDNSSPCIFTNYSHQLFQTLHKLRHVTDINEDLDLDPKETRKVNQLL